MAGLTSTRMKDLLKEASSAFDFVVVDSPPATLVPDAGILASLVDAAIHVIGAGSTPHGTIQRAIAALGRERILGTVLNRADKTSVGSYGYGIPGK
jgi:Mrp family chromosome partitioning ATPase